MKTLKAISYIASAAFVWLAATGCSDEDNISPSPAVSEGCQQVYFSADNEDLTFVSTDKREATLVVKRMATDGALEVPVKVISADEGVGIPEKVLFAAGEETATIAISAPEKMEEARRYTYQIELTGDHVDPYTMLQGSIRFSGALLLPMSFTAQCCFLNKFYELGEYFGQEVQQMTDTQYLINDFLHSGEPLTISITGNDVNVSSPNGMDYSYAWFLPIPSYPAGTDYYITAMYIYQTGYSRYFNDENGKGVMLYLYCAYSDGSVGFDNLYIYFNE